MKTRENVLFTVQVDVESIVKKIRKTHELSFSIIQKLHLEVLVQDACFKFSFKVKGYKPIHKPIQKCSTEHKQSIKEDGERLILPLI